MKWLAVAALAALVGVSVGGASAASHACPSKNRPNTLLLAGGSGQTAQLGKPFPTPFQVRLANTNGCPLTGNLAGLTIDFDAPGAGPSGLFASTGSNHAYVGTDAQGVATAPSFVANHTQGAYTVDAHSDYGTVQLFVSNTAAGVPTSVAATAGDGQDAAAGGRYEQQLQARVADANGNPVQGVAVTFSIVPGATGAGGSFLGQPTATTGSDGVAFAPPLLANATPGRFTVTASADGVVLPATYTLDNHAAAAQLTAGDVAARATVEGWYRPLSVTVRDSTGQAVEGAAVTFGLGQSAAGAGASFVGGAAQATAVTDENGLALSPPLAANKVAGSFSATATASGVTVRYSLTNLAGAPAAIVAGAASGQATRARTRFPVPLAVTVTDRDGNPVAGAAVVFSAPAKGPSGRFGGHMRVRVRTGAKGIAVAPALTANRRAGGYVVVATVGSHRAAFALVNLPR